MVANAYRRNDGRLACSPLSSCMRCQTVLGRLIFSRSAISSWHAANSSQAAPFLRALPNCGHLCATNAAQPSGGGPVPGPSPAWRAGPTYFATVLRSNPRLLAIARSGRPAAQCSNTSSTSATRKLLRPTATPLPRELWPEWFQALRQLAAWWLNYLNIEVAEFIEHFSPSLAEI